MFKIEQKPKLSDLGNMFMVVRGKIGLCCAACCRKQFTLPIEEDLKQWCTICNKSIFLARLQSENPRLTDQTHNTLIT